eukprot:COSAG05_NODE_3322_length_2150_cov_1.173086_4_plen_87_part_00
MLLCLTRSSMTLHHMDGRSSFVALALRGRAMGWNGQQRMWSMWGPRERALRCDCWLSPMALLVYTTPSAHVAGQCQNVSGELPFGW